MRRGSTLAIPSRASLSLVCLAAACTGPAGPTETPKTTRLPAAESAEPERSESARIVARSEDVEPAEVFDSATGERSYRIRYRFSPEKKLYYIIENEFRDRGGVPDFGLTFVTSVKDRRTVIQSVARGTPADERKHGGESVNLTWVFDRYEVTERGMKEKISFDSLRESAPKKKLLPLGTIAGSNASFLFNSRTGEASECVITPARLPETGADLNPLKRVAGRPRLSRTAQRCALTSKNLNRLLDDLGPLFLPNALKRVGEEWTNQRVEDVRSIGRVITDYTFRLTDVWEDGGRKIARIEVSGAASLAKASSNDAAAQLQSPRGSRRQPRRDFTIDRQVCRGTIDFDLTARR